MICFLDLSTAAAIVLAANIFVTQNHGCGSGLIQSGSGSGSTIFPQSESGTSKFLNPDPMRIRIHKGKFEDNFIF
jgi:hypothetical protein